MLGQGSYILADVSKLTQIHPSRVRSWFKHRPDGIGLGPIFDSDYPPVHGDYAVSFLDLIDVLVAGQFRDKYNVPMRTVRRAHTLLQKELDTKHPFCRSDLYTDRMRIFRCAANNLGEDKLSDVVSHQQFFLHIREKLDHIEYSKITQLASRWRIEQGVVLDPLISMGKPTIINTGLTTFVIANQFQANSENAALVADLYGISEKDVANAVSFEDKHGRLHAA
jgi:uncharacterized protein (DUF433 family)